MIRKSSHLLPNNTQENFTRFMRLRKNKAMCTLLTQTRLNLNDFIYPLFVVNGKNIKNAISSMPDLHQFSIDTLLFECENLLNIGVKNFLLFGVLSSSEKDSRGSCALNEDHIIARATREIKAHFSEALIIADLCFCEYTSHGHCGVLENGAINNDQSIQNLGAQGLILAQSGVDILAPSASLDGMVFAIRRALDESGFINTPIMSYSTKFASAYYGPFRDIASSSPSRSDDLEQIPKNRLTYQQNYANINEAILESLEDELQGADILMVKPALAYLDVVAKLRSSTLLPIASYNVSAEFAMAKFGAKMGLFDYKEMMLENLTALKRAGSDIIISYHTKDLAILLKEENGQSV